MVRRSHILGASLNPFCALIGVLLLALLPLPTVAAQSSLLDIELSDPQAFIAVAEAQLGGKGRSDLDPLTESFVRTRLGHAYTLLNRVGEAESQYQLAWVIYQGSAEPFDCASPTEAVAEYYRSQVTALPRAYALASEERRSARPFPEFAVGFARTRDVALLQPPVVVSQEGDVYRVSVEVLARDLSPEGETATQFVGTWLVRQMANRCTLEGAEIRVA